MERDGTLLRKYGATPEALRQKVVKAVGNGAEDGRVDTPTGTPTLDKFGRDLTAMARQGEFDPVLGRALEIENTIEVLARQRRTSVGKIELAKALAETVFGDE